YTARVKFGHCSDVRCTTAFPVKAELHPRCLLCRDRERRRPMRNEIVLRLCPVMARLGMAKRSNYVCSWGPSGRNVLAATSSTGFDPTAITGRIEIPQFQRTRAHLKAALGMVPQSAPKADYAPFIRYQRIDCRRWPGRADTGDGTCLTRRRCDR